MVLTSLDYNFGKTLSLKDIRFTLKNEILVFKDRNVSVVTRYGKVFSNEMGIKIHKIAVH